MRVHVVVGAEQEVEARTQFLDKKANQSEHK